MTKLNALVILAAAVAGAHGFSAQPSPRASTRLLSATNDVETASSRRGFLSTAAAAGGAALLPLLAPAAPAHASGGATAGKYTTIPIAKRRYYGRVQEAVHEFLLMAPAIIKGDTTDPTVQVRGLAMWCLNSEAQCSAFQCNLCADH